MLFLRPMFFIYVVLSCIVTLSCIGRKVDSSSQYSILKSNNFKSYYNIIFNAEQLIKQQESALNDLNNFDVEKTFSVFSEPNEFISNPLMDSIINKVYKVLQDDSSPDFYHISYYLIAKANYYKGDLYKANAYFDLLLDADRADLSFEAYLWKSRSLLLMSHPHEARAMIDSAKSLILGNDIRQGLHFAAEANYNLQVHDTVKTISFLEEALRFEKSRNVRGSWYWLLANLFDISNKEEEAICYYQKLKNSNTPYAMALGSELRLKQISIRTKHLDKAERQHAFKKILEDPKNISYKDFIISQMYDTLYNQPKKILKPTHHLSLSTAHNNEVDKEMVKLLQQHYERLFQLYQEGNYELVIKQSSSILSQTNKLDIAIYPQIHYLKALAVGRSSNLSDFMQALNEIPLLYPQDEIVTPLVKEQLVRLSQNVNLYVKWQSPLEDVPKDFTEFSAQFGTAPWPKLDPKIGDKFGIPIAINKENTGSQQTLIQDNEDSRLKGEYYLVVNVNDIKINLSPSRYGIGQFNRTRYKNRDINHTLLPVNNENQLILIGVFNTFHAVKDYELIFLSLLDKIMKVPPEKYNTFVVRKEDLSSLTDRATIEEFYQTYIKSN